MFADVSRRPGRTMSPVLLLAAIVAALVFFGAVAVVAPSGARAATITTMAANCGANLRTSASTSARIRASIDRNTKVTVVATVKGGSWRTTCAGKSVSGGKWFRIGAVNGRSVQRLYGVGYLYAASGLFRVVPGTAYAACSGVSLRTSTSTSAPRKDTLDAGTRITVVATVDGGAWDADCAGRSVAGSRWYKIGAVNGKSVLYTYGVGYLYAATGLFGSSPPPAPEAEPPAEPAPPVGITEGIDVSHWQGAIDWGKVRAAGKRFVFIKASEDVDFVDNKYGTNRAGARAAGLLVGAYHFARPESAAGDATAEADHFVNTANVAKGELLPVLDLEHTGGLSQAALQTWTRTFLERVYQRTGSRAIVYVAPSFWKSNMGDTTWFADNGYKVLWVAHWTTASDPSIPAQNWGGEGWTFWQYTSSGTVPGISGRVDLNRYNGSDFKPVLVP
jgi:GH25 family lysozyme M1 (1,4-beta-N-acetylmuramidase)